MEQLKVFLTVLKKYHFWVLCGLVLVATLVCWWLATAGLASQFTTRKDQISKAFDSVNVKQGHPNEAIIKKVRELEGGLEAEVYRAWEILYRQQKEKNPIPPELGEEFKKRFESLGPKGELDSQYRDIYMNYIKAYFPTLLQKVNVRRPAAGSAAGARTGGNSPAERFGGGLQRRLMPGVGVPADDTMIGVVDWDDYDRIVGRFDWRAPPSTLEIVMAQEELWVYEALLRVIVNTNKEATSQTNAAVKRIQALDIGAVAALGPPASAAAGAAPGGVAARGRGQGASGGGGGGAPSRGAGGRGGGPRGPEGETTLDQSSKGLDGRYVDANGSPLPYDANQPYAANHPYAEFKMMPIHMSLVMDERRLPDLLVECANSNMPIEVQRVRITRVPSSVSFGVGGAAVGEGRGGGPRGGSSLAARMRGGEGGLGRRETQDVSSYDAPVEINGVIYIYNPPDREKLGTGAASVEKPAEASAPSGAKAPAPATPPATGPAASPAAAPATAPTAPPAAAPGTSPPPAATSPAPAAGASAKPAAGPPSP